MYEIIGLLIIVFILLENYNEELFILECIWWGELVELYEIVCWYKSGWMFDVLLIVLLIRDKNGVIVGVLKIVCDIFCCKVIENVLVCCMCMLEIFNCVGNVLVVECEFEKVVWIIVDVGCEIFGVGLGGLFCNSLDEKIGYVDFYIFFGECWVFERCLVLCDDVFFGLVVCGEGFVWIDDV